MYLALGLFTPPPGQIPTWVRCARLALSTEYKLGANQFPCVDWLPRPPDGLKVPSETVAKEGSY